MSQRYKPRVYIQGRFMNRATGQLFVDRGYHLEKDDPSDADIIVWTGGEDISPALYGEDCLTCTWPTIKRDQEDVEVFNHVCNKSALVGICRGAQLLNCLNQGKLWQDVDSHHSYHHKIWDLVTGEELTINSVHHQMMIPAKHAELVAYASESTWKVGANNKWERSVGVESEWDIDPEVVFYPDTTSLCFQAHPEFGHPPTTKYFFELIDRYINVT